ncbi:hypothetical protein CIPAW_03G192500 [Carya illinoinensis]|uniref:Uncharacterized protein n=1 Tax=Carya illinoinensis TaxID=32201 RepID=A0A8T1R5P6_CARIL|nr:hypothetical protein CIPAW_03G192500 [Carya illinoinensis]
MCRLVNCDEMILETCCYLFLFTQLCPFPISYSCDVVLLPSLIDTNIIEFCIPISPNQPMPLCPLPPPCVFLFQQKIKLLLYAFLFFHSPGICTALQVTQQLSLFLYSSISVSNRMFTPFLKPLPCLRSWSNQFLLHYYLAKLLILSHYILLS